MYEKAFLFSHKLYLFVCKNVGPNDTSQAQLFLHSLMIVL